MSPLITRIFLGLTLILAISAAVFSLDAIQANQKEAWATLAASLAVITSMVSAWGAQRVVELEEAKLSPYVYPQFDTTSRYGLMLFKVTNFGGGVAHNIKFTWDKPLKSSDGTGVRFSTDEEPGELSVLVPGQHVSKIVDGHINFFQIPGPHIYEGYVEYQDSNKRKFRHRFLLDAESYKGTPMHDEESTKTHYELQKLPERVKELSNEVKKFREQFDRN